MLTILTGIVYPALVTVVAQVVSNDQANGSIVLQDGKAIGSSLIGQGFDDPKYFWSRPSATGPNGYNSAASSGSHLGPINPALLDAAKGRVETILAAHPDQKGPVPVDLVTASGSGLDPHISLAEAEFQVARVAKIRGVGEDKICDLVTSNTNGQTLGLMGEPRVNVLKLNLLLDAIGTK